MASRVRALLSGIKVISEQAGIYNPVSTCIIDTRLREYDTQPVFGFYFSNPDDE